MNLIIVAGVLTAVTAMPSYIAVPADQIAFLDLTSLGPRRVPRQTLSPPPPSLPQSAYENNYQPIPIQSYQQSIALAPPPIPILQQKPQIQNEAASTSVGTATQYEERPPDFGEYVDFGAHTGDNGAFGWYADYPINNHDDSNYKK